MPTMATFMQLLPAGFQGKTSRSTDSTVYCVVEGRGTARIGEQEFHFGPRDVFVAPSWQPLQLAALEDATLFSYSDRPVQAALASGAKRAPTERAAPRAFPFSDSPASEG